MSPTPLVIADHHVRIARPSRDLAAAERFWCEGVGLEVQWRTGAEAEGGHALLMLGPPGGAWHLELVADAEQLAAHRPGPEDLLVVYRATRLDEGERARLEAAGGTVVASRNPYWDEHGVTVRDPDGHLLVLSHRTWG